MAMIGKFRTTNKIDPIILAATRKKEMKTELRSAFAHLAILFNASPQSIRQCSDADS